MARRTSQNTNQRSTRRNDSQATETTSRTRRSSRNENASKKAAETSKKSTRRATGSKSSASRNGETMRERRKAEAEQRKRQHTKERANRMYDRQVAASTRSTSEESGPRAALYEGKMGSKHRKSTRMQRSSEAEPVSAKINPAGWFSNINVSPRTLRVVTAVLCIILVGVFLYVPAKHYYQAQREHDRLVAEYAVVEQRNDSLDEQNDALASDAGMEDAVREKYGYISPGEETAVVTGLSEATVESERQAAEVEGNVLSSSVKAPEEWYTPLLDTFFGVE